MNLEEPRDNGRVRIHATRFSLQVGNSGMILNGNPGCLFHCPTVHGLACTFISLLQTCLW